MAGILLSLQKCILQSLVIELGPFKIKQALQQDLHSP